MEPMEPNSLKCSSIQTVHSIELKFAMYIIGHRLTYCADFSKFRINRFFFLFLQQHKKEFLYITTYRVKL